MADKITRREFVRDGAVAAAGVAAGLAATQTVHAGNPEKADTSKIVNYNPDMEYRRCGKTDWMTSAVCLGGHWKRVNLVVPGLFQGSSWLSAKLDSPEFEKNRYDLVTRCIERGINYIDACTVQEVIMYSKALKGRRDKMHLGFSWYQEEMRGLSGQYQSAKKAGTPKPPGWITENLKAAIDRGFKQTGLEYVDLWRITMHEQSARHENDEVEEMVEALNWAKQTGRARFTGISSHHRSHIKWMIETYPETFDVIVTPYTAKTKVVEDTDGLWAAMQKGDVGWFGIKPFAGTSLFKGTSAPDDPNFEEDNRLARLTIRYILCNQAITAPIPGMITPQQVDNVALAVMERRELDPEEKAELDRAMDRAWANLPYHYQWLKNWEYV
ncbi:MAG TPA: aldo/keto reductase [Thermoguttaceae bacterium]|nr:aldo/keto reductase [Thermoguttaceae bacterium]